MSLTFGVPVICPLEEPKEVPVGNAPDVTEYVTEQKDQNHLLLQHHMAQHQY